MRCGFSIFVSFHAFVRVLSFRHFFVKYIFETNWYQKTLCYPSFFGICNCLQERPEFLSNNYVERLALFLFFWSFSSVFQFIFSKWIFVSFLLFFMAVKSQYYSVSVSILIFFVIGLSRNKNWVLGLERVVNIKLIWNNFYEVFIKDDYQIQKVP